MSTYKLPLATNFTTKIDNKNTHLITLKNRTGMQIALTDYGARLVSVLVPNNRGELIDVVLGYDSINGYIEAQEQYQGATVGRFCNRIAAGKFTLAGENYELAQNNNGNSLHGGIEGFHRKIWDRQVSFNKQVDFYYVSPDGEEGFPGELNTTVSYELTNNNEIIIRFRARTTKTTVINLTNHAYFNLEGEGHGDSLGHEICIHSDEYLPINEKQIPTGEIAPVAGTVFDFRTPKMLGLDIGAAEEQLIFASGYDHTFVNNQPISQAIASAYSKTSGIELEVYTSEPGIHLYSGNFMADDKGKSGNKYLRYGGFCFEAQHYPDSPNQPHFPSVILQPGEEFNSEIRFKFNLKKEA
ncbi:aldose epimerase family protein [Sphingobacterium sp. HJSM2_6]|uniref:aldose epimerase family protein n=1 Tax=Sphingobacterium sp. HJSM2_6 TaxID=3366264 RepID=UPI003BBE9ADF